MQIHANTPTFYANPCKYSSFLCKSLQICLLFMQIHANTLTFLQIHANTVVFYANTNVFHANAFFAQKVQKIPKSESTDLV